MNIVVERVLLYNLIKKQSFIFLNHLSSANSMQIVDGNPPPMPFAELSIQNEYI